MVSVDRKVESILYLDELERSKYSSWTVESVVYIGSEKGYQVVMTRTKEERLDD